MKHVRYIGNTITLFCAVLTVFFAVFPFFAVLFILKNEISIPTIIIIAFSVLYTVIICLYGRSVNITMQLYTWCEFEKDNVTIRTLFHKKNQIDYANCNDVGIGYYTHGIFNSNIGSKISYIYLSYHKIDPKYKCQINLLKPSKTCIKIGFRQNTIRFLLNNLPPKQLKMLENSFSEYQHEIVKQHFSLKTRGRFSK